MGGGVDGVSFGGRKVFGPDAGTVVYVDFWISTTGFRGVYSQSELVTSFRFYQTHNTNQELAKIDC
jgi:hypothetical protein